MKLIRHIAIIKNPKGNDGDEENREACDCIRIIKADGRVTVRKLNNSKQ